MRPEMIYRLRHLKLFNLVYQADNLQVRLESKPVRSAAGTNFENFRYRISIFRSSGMSPVNGEKSFLSFVQSVHGRFAGYTHPNPDRKRISCTASW
jgi:hypothetical protein